MATASQDLGAPVSPPRGTPPQVFKHHNHSYTSTHDWVESNAACPPPPPLGVIDLQDSNVNEECCDRNDSMHHRYPRAPDFYNVPCQPNHGPPAFQRDHPPHLPRGHQYGTAGGGSSGPNDPRSSSSSSTYIPRHCRDDSPPPRCHRRHSHSLSSESRQQSRMPPAHENVPEYMHNHRECTFELLTPGACLFHKDPDRPHHCHQSQSASPIFHAPLLPMRNRVPQVPCPVVPV